MIDIVLKKRKKGMSNLITLLFAIFLLCLFSMLLITTPLKQLALQTLLNEVGRSALLKIEADGGLTNETKEMIKNRFQDKGLDVGDLTISCNSVITPTNPTPLNYGENLTLELSFKYSYTEKEYVGFNITDGETKEDVVKFKGSCTSKN